MAYDYSLSSLGMIPADRIQTSASGASYIGGMAPQLPTENMSFMWGGPPRSLDEQINSLYATVGKTPDMIDQEGRDYWTQRLAAGEDITGAFMDSARTVYGNMLAGQPSPYEAQNVAGYNNLPQSSPLRQGGGRPDGRGRNAATGQGGYGMGSNPYMGAQADAMRAQQQLFLDGAMNGIRSDSVGVGGLGGTRQGVAQGVAAGQAATGLSSSLANLYGSNWNAEQNRELQRYGMDQGFYTAQRGLDQSGTALGASLYGLANNGDWSGLNQANGIYGNYTGFGNTTTSGQSGGGWQGGVGGALSGAALAKQLNWW